MADIPVITTRFKLNIPGDNYDQSGTLVFRMCENQAFVSTSTNEIIFLTKSIEHPACFLEFIEIHDTGLPLFADEIKKIPVCLRKRGILLS